MYVTPETVAVLGQINRDALPDRCDIETQITAPTATGGKVLNFQAERIEDRNVACRVSRIGAPRETVTGNSAKSEADYVVAFDGANERVKRLGAGMRLNVTTLQLMLYVLAVDGPQSLDPFPKIWCTTRPQPGQ